jgi:hypothetical protein
VAKNTGIGYRKGAINERSQVVNPANGNWTKRDSKSGRFTSQKTDKQPFKGVRKEGARKEK